VPKELFEEYTTFGIEQMASMRNIYCVYVIKSKKNGKFYVGQTNDLHRRLLQHEQGLTSFGRRNKNLSLVFKKEFPDRTQAVRFERFLKKQKSHTFIERLIKGEIVLPR
jgi:putative endonuclease